MFKKKTISPVLRLINSNFVCCSIIEDKAGVPSFFVLVKSQIEKKSKILNLANQ